MIARLGLLLCVDMMGVALVDLDIRRIRGRPDDSVLLFLEQLDRLFLPEGGRPHSYFCIV